MSDLPVHDLPIISYAIDDVAMASLRAPKVEAVCCSVCDAEIAEGAPMSSGLMLWSRGDEMRVDEPPMCGGCAASIGMSLFARWSSFNGEEPVS